VVEPPSEVVGVEVVVGAEVAVPDVEVADDPVALPEVVPL
jgi:hypothetical protein